MPQIHEGRPSRCLPTGRRQQSRQWEFKNIVEALLSAKIPFNKLDRSAV